MEIINITKNSYFEAKEKYHISYFILYLLNLFLGLIYYFLLKIISFFIKVNINFIDTSRVGHLIVDGILHAEHLKKINLRNKYYLFCAYKKKICNNFFFEKLKKNLRIVNINFFLPLFILKDFLYNYNINLQISDLPLRKFKTEFFELLDNQKTFFFTAKEYEEGNTILKNNFNIVDNDKIVCIIIRDSSYLEKKDSGFEFRNYNPKNFIPAINKLIELGYYVFLMGKKNTLNLPIQHDRLIHYSNSGISSDFMDFYLAKRCSFYISTTTGIDHSAYIFNKPIGYLVISLGYIFFLRDNNFYLPSNFINYKKKKISLQELFKAGLFFCNTKEEFEKTNILPTHNTEDEITNFFLEIHNHCEKKKNELYSRRNQDMFWNKYSKLYMTSTYGKKVFKNNVFFSKSVISDYYLRKNRDWYLND